MNNTSEGWECEDCEKNCFTNSKDYYTIKHDLWDKLGVGEGMLCMGCLEERLGRKLEFQDLLPCFLNSYLNPYTKEIIRKNFIIRQN